MIDAPSQPLLICTTVGGRLAIAAHEVAAVLPMLPLWRPPGLPRPIAGFVSVGGETLAVIAPAQLLDAAVPAGAVGLYAHLVRLDREPACLLVDRAEDLVTPAPDAVGTIGPGASFNGCVTAEVTLADGVAHLIDVARLLTEAERSRIAALTDEAARRAAEWAA